jgi:ATP-dependent DNA helicase RecG
MGRALSSLDISVLKGVGPKVRDLLSKLGILNIRDALLYLPFRYEDRRDISEIINASDGAQQNFIGKVASSDLLDLSQGGKHVRYDPRQTRSYKGRGRSRYMTEIVVNDGTGLIKCKWFNQPWLAGKFKKGTQVFVSGKVKRTRWAPHFEIDNPVFDLIEEKPEKPEKLEKPENLETNKKPEEKALHEGQAIPVYLSTEGISPKKLRSIILSALEGYGAEIEDEIPQDILKREGLPGLRESVQAVHVPPEDADIVAMNCVATHWQRRLIFGEFFMLEAGLAVLRRGRKVKKGIAFKPVESGLVNRLLGELPFELTGAQITVLTGIFDDMAEPRPMNRLIQGDVGSGKTIVALLSMLRAVECGYQAALMAPTEILAEQHYINIHNLLESLGVKVALLTGTIKKHLEDIESGEADVVIGTHAIIQKGVKFKALGLAVVDEQHRFGVMQRAMIKKKAELNPDVLIMTATPIPRTLSLTLYGDLDYSVIDELPPGRTPVATTSHAPDDKPRVYEAIKDEVGSGGQVYVVYPMIEETENSDLKSVTTGLDALTRMYPEMRVRMVHGKMRPKEKEEVMAGFKKGVIDILVSTTVIEVGVDVSNASLMVIVNSERFGLAQLHQLRGRVGRGKRESRCMLLYSGPLSDEAARRIEVMCTTNDGFRISEVDLEIRGPGEFLGTKQSGMPDLKVANIIRDARVLEMARREAFALIGEDPELARHPELKRELERFWRGRVELFATG